MELDVIENNCSGLARLFHQIITDMKNGAIVWEDFAGKATRLHSCLRSMALAAASFLESFQKVADAATNTRGATREIGAALTRLCMRHRTIESKLKIIISAVMDSLVIPLQEKMEDWKKFVIQLEKDHSRDSKKAHQDLKKASSDSARLEKKIKKGKVDFQQQFETSRQEVKEKLVALQDIEKKAVQTALVEERVRHCHLISCVKPLVDGEISLLRDMTHLQEIIDSLCKQATEPQVLPLASEQVILDIITSQSNDESWTNQSSSSSSLSSISSSRSPSRSPTRKNHQHWNTSQGDFAFNKVPNLPSYGKNNIYSSPSASCLERPHTISSSYEHQHSRPALAHDTFEPPSGQHCPPVQPCSVPSTPDPIFENFQRQRARPCSLARDIKLNEIYLNHTPPSLRNAPNDRNGNGMAVSMDSAELAKRLSGVQVPLRNSDIYEKIYAGRMGKTGKDEVATGFLSNKLNRANSEQQSKIPNAEEKIYQDMSNGKSDPLGNRSAVSMHHSASCTGIVGMKGGVEKLGRIDTQGNLGESSILRRNSMQIQESSVYEARPVRHMSFVAVSNNDNEYADPNSLLTYKVPHKTECHYQSLDVVPKSDNECTYVNFLLPPTQFCVPDGVSNRNFHSRSFDGFSAEQLNETASKNFQNVIAANQSFRDLSNSQAAREHLSFQEAALFDECLRNPWQMMGSLQSPDDVTPTNENQPHDFLMQMESRGQARQSWPDNLIAPPSDFNNKSSTEGENRESAI